MVFQNVFDSINRKTGEVHYRTDIVEQRAEAWVQACPPPKAATIGSR